MRSLPTQKAMTINRNRSKSFLPPMFLLIAMFLGFSGIWVAVNDIRAIKPSTKPSRVRAESEDLKVIDGKKWTLITVLGYKSSDSNIKKIPVDLKVVEDAKRAGADFILLQSEDKVIELCLIKVGTGQFISQKVNQKFKEQFPEAMQEATK